MKTLVLSRGQKALVDDDIFDIVKNQRWHAIKRRSTWYARGNWKERIGKFKKVYLHHIVMGRPLSPFEIDHIDGNGLNNIRENLRIVTYRVNQWNRKSRREGKASSRFVGVRARCKKWAAQVTINGKTRHLGTFSNQQDASVCYLKAVKQGE